MPLDAQIQVMLEEIAALNLPPLQILTVEQARARELASIDLTRGEAVARVENRDIPGPSGSISLRLYWPQGAGPFPFLISFHGGGFVLGNLDTYDAICRTVTNQARCLTVSVGYRLAPEHPFPAAVEDCYAATTWAAAHAAELGGDATRLAVGGNSAGGNLAAVVCRLARDRGGPPLIYQWLIYPVLDRPGTTPSYTENAEGYELTRESMFWFWHQYLPDRSLDHDPRAAPLQAADLHNLPPALIVTAEFDPLRDEGELYARRLQQADVPVQLVRYDGMIHGFFGYPGAHPGARDALLAATSSLRAAFDAPSAGAK